MAWNHDALRFGRPDPTRAGTVTHRGLRPSLAAMRRAIKARRMITLDSSRSLAAVAYRAFSSIGTPITPPEHFLHWKFRPCEIV